MVSSPPTQSFGGLLSVTKSTILTEREESRPLRYIGQNPNGQKF